MHFVGIFQSKIQVVRIAKTGEKLFTDSLLGSIMLLWTREKTNLGGEK